MEPSDIRDRLRRKCDRLRAVGPALQGRSPLPHEYRFDEPIGEDDALRYARSGEFALPEDYLWFVTHVGNGGAGPGGGLLKAPSEREVMNVARRPFPYLGF